MRDVVPIVPYKTDRSYRNHSPRRIVNKLMLLLAAMDVPGGKGCSEGAVPYLSMSDTDSNILQRLTLRI